MTLGVMVSSAPRLLLRAMSGSMALPQPGAALISVTHDTIKGNVRDLVHYLGPCCGPMATLLWGPCQFKWTALPPGAMMMSKPGMLTVTMSGPWSSHGQVDVHDL